MNKILGFIPFVQPIPGLWDYWAWLLVPLCLAVGVVYKAIKCASMKQVPRQALAVAAYILISMVAAGGVLAGVVQFLPKLLKP